MPDKLNQTSSQEVYPEDRKGLYEDKKSRVERSSFGDRMSHYNDVSATLRRTNLSPEQNKIMIETDTLQKEKIDNAIAEIKGHFDQLNTHSNNRAKNSVKAMYVSFIKELINISENIENSRIEVAEDYSLNIEEKVKKIKEEIIPSFDNKIVEILNWSMHFAKDLKENGGANSLELLLKAEGELSVLLDLIHKDEEIKEAMAFVLGFSFDGISLEEKEEKVFTTLAKNLLEKQSQKNAFSLIISKLSLSQRITFREKYFKDKKTDLIEKIQNSKDIEYTSIFIDLYGENEYLTTQNKNSPESREMIEAIRARKDFSELAENHHKKSIGASNSAIDMLSAQNIAGFAGITWGVATTGLNIFATLGSGKFKENPSKAIGDVFKNPYVWLGAGAVAGGNALLTGQSFSSMADSFNPGPSDNEKNYHSTRRFFKNLLVSNSDPRFELISKNKSALYALADFGEKLLRIQEIKDPSKIDKNLLNKKYFSDHLSLMISEADKNSEEYKELIELEKFILDKDYDDRAFADLIINILNSEIKGENLEETEKRYNALLKDL